MKDARSILYPGQGVDTARIERQSQALSLTIGLFARPERQSALVTQRRRQPAERVRFGGKAKLRDDLLDRKICPHSLHVHPDRAKRRHRIYSKVVSMREVEKQLNLR